MPTVEVPEPMLDILQHEVRTSSTYDSVSALVKCVLMEYLVKHDRIGQLHVQLPTLLMTSADNVSAVSTTINTIDWYNSQEPIDMALDHLREAENLLRKTAHKLE